MTAQDLLALHDGRVLSRLEASVLHITLNTPDSLNAVSAEMLETVEAVVRHAGNHRDQVRAIVMRGAGRGFCSGAALSADGAPSTATLDLGAAAVTAVRQSPLPVVAAVHGACAGIGVSLALSADVVLAAESAFFMLAFTKIGLMPDGGATALVAASVGRARAMRMALSAERVSAADAYDWGLVAHRCADDEFDDTLSQLVEHLSTGPSAAFAATKAAVNEATLQQLDPALHRERYGQTALMQTADFTEGVAAFTERRPARFSGA